MLDLKSLIITRNSQGPKHVPWGTPAGTVSQLEKQSEFNFTLWLLSLKNSIIQFTTVGFTDRLYNLAISKLWSTKSKAFLKSNNTVLTSALRLSHALTSDGTLR